MNKVSLIFFHELSANVKRIHLSYVQHITDEIYQIRKIGNYFEQMEHFQKIGKNVMLGGL